MRRAVLNIARWSASCAAAATLAAGCAAVRPLANGTGDVAPATHTAPLVPPTLELPDWKAPDLAAWFDPEERRPSNNRDWVDEQRLLPRAEIDGDQLHIQHVRNARFFSYRDCIVEYYDQSYDLTKLRTVDFIMIPFADNRAIAHTMLSFGFDDGNQIGVSVEVRLEKGETYSAAVGLLGQFELMYVVADERDLLPVRPEHRGVDVLLYRSTATPKQARALLLDIMQRVNQLYDQPEFYDTLRNNCTTNIVRHINAIAPDHVPYDYRVILPGYADSLAYELGLIDNSLPFEETRRRAVISSKVLKYKDDPQFSTRIREELVR
jgi:hypothetical protein